MKCRGVQKSNKIHYLAISNILPNPYQPRRSCDNEELNELAESIRRYGVLQPILVRVINKNIYELVCGERRLRASKLIGFEHIPAILVSLGDRDVAAVCMNENMHRQQYSYMEEAEGIRVMTEGFRYSYDETAAMLERPREKIEHMAEFLNMPKSIKRAVINLRVSEKIARLLLGLKNEALMAEVLEDMRQFDVSDECADKLIDNVQRRNGIYRGIGKTERLYHKMRKNIDNIRMINEAMKRTMLIIKDCGVKSEYRVQKTRNNYEVSIKVPMEND